MIAFQYITDYLLNRDTYSAESTYIRKYVDRLSVDESLSDYEQRLRQTPSPTFARKLADKILVAFRERMRFAVRYGALVDHVQDSRGVDNCGSTVADYIQSLAKEIAINGRVGVLVTRVNGGKPYFVTIRAEQIGDFEYTDPDQRGVFSKVEWSDARGSIKYWLSGDGKAMFQAGDAEPVDSELGVIPFVLIEGDSIIAKIAQHQRTLANLLSVAAVESPGLLQTFLARQKDSFQNTTHQRGIDDDVQIGRNRGLWYGKGENAPSFVAQPSGPATEAREWVAALIHQMESLAGLAGDTEGERIAALASAAGSLGAVLESAERQLWSYCQLFTPSAQHAHVIRYPRTWQAQTEAERLADLNALYESAEKARGRKAMEAATILAVEQAFAGSSSQEIQAAVDAVRKARCLTNDPLSVIRAYEAKALDGETVADALGCIAGVADSAKAEFAAKAAALAAAAAAANHGSETVGTDRDSQLAEKEMSQQDASQVRGEGK